MKIKHLYYVLSLMIAISVVLTACAPQAAATQAPSVQTEAPAMTEAPATEAPATEVPTAAPTTPTAVLQSLAVAGWSQPYPGWR